MSSFAIMMRHRCTQLATGMTLHNTGLQANKRTLSGVHDGHEGLIDARDGHHDAEEVDLAAAHPHHETHEAHVLEHTLGSPV